MDKINSKTDPMGPGRWILSGVITALALLSILILPSCRDTDGSHKIVKEDIGKTPAAAIHKTYERGPATLSVDVDHSEITIADRLNLTITITVDENYGFELPKFGEKLEQFGIIDYHTSQPELTESKKKKISRSYLLEPFLSGEYKIPPMKALFWKEGEKETGAHEIESEELMITVTSLLPEKMAEMKIHDIVPPLSLPRSFNPWMAGGMGAGVVIALILAGFLIYKKMSSNKPVLKKRIPAHELAYLELSKLVEQKLVEKGEIKPFYHGLSDILRRYIERRFGLSAPEQTTEEFLTHLRKSNGFIRQYNSLLKNFLSGCDLVKFAEHQPSTEDIQFMFDSCKAFISGTEEKQETRE